MRPYGSDGTVPSTQHALPPLTSTMRASPAELVLHLPPPDRCGPEGTPLTCKPASRKHTARGTARQTGARNSPDFSASPAKRPGTSHLSSWGVFPVATKTTSRAWVSASSSLDTQESPPAGYEGAWDSSRPAGHRPLGSLCPDYLCSGDPRPYDPNPPAGLPEMSGPPRASWRLEAGSLRVGLPPPQAGCPVNICAQIPSVGEEVPEVALQPDADPTPTPISQNQERCGV